MRDKRPIVLLRIDGERGEQSSGRREPCLSIDREGKGDDIVERAVEVRPELRRHRACVGRDSKDELRGCVVAVRSDRLGVRAKELTDLTAGPDASQRQHLEQDDAQRKHIRALVDPLARRLFGGHVTERADHPSLGRPGLGGVEELREAEVEDLYLAIDEDHVRRFQVAMHDAPRMGGTHGAAHLLEYASQGIVGVVIVDRRSQAQAVFECGTLEVLHREERLGAVELHVDRSHDVRVLELGQCLRFSAEAFDEPPAHSIFGMEQFEGYGPPCCKFSCEPDDGHPARSDPPIE